MSDFKKVNPLKLTDNLFKLISKDWVLITAGNMEKYNTMTASWGAFGELWNKKVCFIFIRPNRHTYNFVEGADVFTVSSFDDSYRKVLKYCGTKSGRDVDKMNIEGVTPAESENGSIYFNEARIVFECQKIYTHDLDPARFLDDAIDKEYPDKDYHRMYIGEIMNCYIK